MKIFEKGNFEGEESKPCVVCNTKKEGKVVLIPIAGTKDGNIVEATQVHLECLGNLIYYPEHNVIALVTIN